MSTTATKSATAQAQAQAHDATATAAAAAAAAVESAIKTLIEAAKTLSGCSAETLAQVPEDSFADVPQALESLKTFQAQAAEVLAQAERKREAAALAVLGCATLAELEDTTLLCKVSTGSEHGSVHRLTCEVEDGCLIRWTVCKLDSSDFQSLDFGVFAFASGLEPSKVTSQRASASANAARITGLRISSDLATWAAGWLSAPLVKGRRDALKLSQPFQFNHTTKDAEGKDVSTSYRLGSLWAVRKR